MDAQGGDAMMRLTIKLTDGRELSGRYHYLVALARKEWALKQPNCLSAVAEFEDLAVSKAPALASAPDASCDKCLDTIREKPSLYKFGAWMRNRFFNLEPYHFTWRGAISQCVDVTPTFYAACGETVSDMAA